MATHPRLLNWPHVPDGAIWARIYAGRAAIICLQALACGVLGLWHLSIAFLVIGQSYNVWLGYSHHRQKGAHWLLCADGVFAGAILLLSPKLAVGVVVSQLGGSFVGALGRPVKQNNIGIVAGFGLTALAGLKDRDTSLVLFAGTGMLSSIGATHTIRTLVNRRTAASRRLNDLLDGLHAMVFEHDIATGTITYANRRVSEMLGLENVTRDDLSEAIHPDDRIRVHAEIQGAIRARIPATFEARMRSHNGGYFYVEQRTTFTARDGKWRAWSVLVDISDRKRMEHTLKHRSLHDDLTELPNRAFLRDRLVQVAEKARVVGTPFSLLMLDLNKFKDVNDGLGHHAGDALLREVSRRLKSCVGPDDTVARLGGDEFAVLLEGVSVTQALSRANIIVEAVGRNLTLDGTIVNPRVSIGIVDAPTNGSDPADLLRSADAAMYRAKRNGTSVCLFDSIEDERSLRRVKDVAEVRGAIGRGELRAFYQPVVDSPTGTIIGCEALVRWQHPTRGLLGPGEFLQVIAAGGMSVLLAKWIVRNSIKQACEWRYQGYEMPLSVNVSIVDLLDTEFVAWMLSELRSSGFPPHLLTVEITEAELLTDSQRATSILLMIREAGVGVGVDDFGTGYSSMVWLRDLPVSLLKIDRSFVDSMVTDARSRAIVHSTVSLAKELGLRVVGEGVENEATAEALAQLGCTQVQGFFYSQPVAAEEFTQLLTDFQSNLVH